MKTMIAVPCMDMVHTLFFRSVIGMKCFGECEFVITTSSLIYDARNLMARKAIDEGFDRILWLDSDMIFEPDLFMRLSERLNEGYDFMSALYFKRKDPIEPVIYKTVYSRDLGNGKYEPKAISYTDYPHDSVFEIAASGFGAVMMNVDVVRDVHEKFGLPFSPVIGFGEDLSFCQRAIKSGYKLYCDSTIKCGHMAFRQITEGDYVLRESNI